MADFGTDGKDTDKSIPFDDGLSVSHSPLNLGGNSESEPAETVESPQPAVREIGKRVSWPDRITGVKTFYTKLHGGAIDFLEEQINNWLRDNPGVNVKHTNTVVGDLVGKKTEPNIIITVWY